jgi:hypothetical protein
VADDEAPEVAQPSEEPLDLPATLVAPERATVSRLGLLSVAAVWGDHFHAQLRQGRIQRASIVASTPMRR